MFCNLKVAVKKHSCEAFGRTFFEDFTTTVRNTVNCFIILSTS